MVKEKYDFRERVAVAYWHDGDTFYGALDQGVGIFRAGGMRIDPGYGGIITLEPIRMRAALIQAPELTVNGEYNVNGEIALSAAKKFAPPGIYSCITYKGDDTFDRPLIDLVFPDGSRFSSLMVNNGFATYYKP